MSDNVKLLISEKDIRARIKEMADVISHDFDGEEVVVVGILRGAVFFMTELVQKMSIPVTIDFMSASSYGSGTVSSGTLMIEKDLSSPIDGKSVIIVEDIVDTGKTLSILKPNLEERGAKKVVTAVLLDKPSRRVVDFEADYVGFEVPDVFVVGWGLDYDQKYRELEFIGNIEE